MTLSIMAVAIAVGSLARVAYRLGSRVLGAGNRLPHPRGRQRHDHWLDTVTAVSAAH